MEKLESDCFLLDKEKNTIFDLYKLNEFRISDGLFVAYQGVIHNIEEIIKLEANLFQSSGLKGLKGSFFSDYSKHTNYFIWFSISLTNYLRLVFFVELITEKEWNLKDLEERNNKETLKTFIRENISSVIPEIYKWRNKVSAHYSITDPHNRDNLSTLINSTNMVSYQCPFFITNGYTHSNKDTAGDKPNIQPWSITVEFEKLKDRFFSELNNLSIKNRLIQIAPKTKSSDDFDAINFATNIFTQNENLNKNEGVLNYDLIKQLFEKKKFEKALSELKKMIKNEPSNGTLWHNFISCLLNLEENVIVTKVLSILESNKLLTIQMLVLNIKMMGINSKFDEIVELHSKMSIEDLKALNEFDKKNGGINFLIENSKIIVNPKDFVYPTFN